MLTARIETPEAEGLALRTAKHFAHKVEVETRGDVRRVRIPAGEFELEPREGALEVRLFPVDEPGRARLEEVVGSHLQRFSRSGPLTIEWPR